MAHAVRDLASAHGESRQRVLVAEDDVEMRKVLVETLERDGYDVHAVEDGAALLLELARDGRFHHGSVDLVLADIRMPLCSGLQALDTIRGVGIHVPFLLLTAFGGPDVHTEAKRLRAVLVDKPVGMKRLLGVVAGLLKEDTAK